MRTWLLLPWALAWCACGGPGATLDGGGAGGAGGVSATGGAGGSAGGAATGGGAAAGGGAATGGGTETPDAGLLSREALCDQRATYWCACELARGKLRPQDEQACVDEQRARCGAEAVALDAGQVRYDAAQAGRCARDSFLPERCNQFGVGCTLGDSSIFVPNGVAGTACNSDAHCGPGFQCPVGSSSMCAACVPHRRTGEPCDALNTCEFTAVGKDIVGPRCLGPVDGGAPHCVWPGQAGEWCSFERSCATDGGRLFCETGFTCVLHEPRLGEPCDETYGITCVEGVCNRVDAGLKLCVPKRPVGGACRDERDCDSQLCFRPYDGGASSCVAEGASCLRGPTVDQNNQCSGGFCQAPLPSSAGACRLYAASADGTWCEIDEECQSAVCVNRFDAGTRRFCGVPPDGTRCESTGTDFCGPGQTCFVLDAGAGYSACYTPAPLGAPCVTTTQLIGTCRSTGAPRAYCVGGTCQPIAPHSLAHGAQCGESIQCPAADFCQHTAAGVCVLRYDAGTTCPYGDECVAGLGCFGVCKPFGDDGAPCSPSYFSADCHTGFWCLNQYDGGSRCRPRITDGGACGPKGTLASCVDGYCNDGGCAPRLDAGAPCDAYDQCLCRRPDGGNLSGDGGVCFPEASTACP
jgi:hypothetical protein